MISKIFQASLLLAGIAPAFASPVPATVVSRAAAVDELVGYGAGTTGGGSGAGVTVTSCTELESAIENGGVIQIDGLLDGCGTLKLPVGDISIIGVGSNSGLKNGGLRVRKLDNVIIRNLIFDTPEKKGDLLDIDASTNIWVDHCEFNSIGLTGGKDDYDGMLDIKHGSDLVTVSWNKFKDHWKGSLVGHSDSNESEDSGKLRVTYHHNDWNNVNSRTPSIRFGTLHLYSSCYTNIPTSGVHTRMGAQGLIEENSFTDTQLAIVTDKDSDEDGFANDVNNIYETSDTSISQVGTLTSVPYEYTADKAADACAIVAASAGVGVVA